jgi:hypothetical protein
MDTHPEQEASAQTMQPIDWIGLPQQQQWMEPSPVKDRAMAIGGEDQEDNTVAEKGYD